MPGHQDDGRWPPFQGPVLGPIIRALIEAPGPACHVCRSASGVFVDHNPDNLQARGLVPALQHLAGDLPPSSGCGWGGVPRFGLRCRTHAERGRGLAIVAAVADEVGHEGDDQVGHRVWATLIG